MSVLLVTYDLSKPGQDYTDFLKIIKSLARAQFVLPPVATPSLVNTSERILVA